MNVLAQLLGHGPMLLASTAGLTVALLLWRRCPRASLLTLIACGLMFATSLAQAFAVATVMEQESTSRLQTMAAIGMIASVTRAAAIGLLVAAVFVDREPRA